uniref:Nematode cuticle collagen N-terminal domain-containing protein n=1 Tax=Romanomermis culicivorax TaxID=13658 RepID=A0A915KG31_ROMCU
MQISVERGRSMAYGAIFCSVFTVLACAIVIPIIHNKLVIMKLNVEKRMTLFKVSTDETWKEMVNMGKNLRLKRQSSWGDVLPPSALPYGNSRYGAPTSSNYQQAVVAPIPAPAGCTGESRKLPKTQLRIGSARTAR